MKLSDLKTDQRFTFPGSEHVYLARGNGWYSTPGGYDGGPWHVCGDPEVKKLQRNLDSGVDTAESIP